MGYRAAVVKSALATLNNGGDEMYHLTESDSEWRRLPSILPGDTIRVRSEGNVIVTQVVSFNHVRFVSGSGEEYSVPLSDIEVIEKAETAANLVDKLESFFPGIADSRILYTEPTFRSINENTVDKKHAPDIS